MIRSFNKCLIPFLALALLIGCAAGVSSAPDRPAASVLSQKDDTADRVAKPFQKSGGKAFRVAVIQSGDYFAYNNVLISIHDGLADLGWTRKVELSAETALSIPKTLDAWNTSGRLGFVEFAPELFIDLNWSESEDPPESMKDILGGRSNADLVISLGTLAGTYVAKIAQAGALKLPVMVESVSDPIGSKIISSFEDSGHDLITASADPEAYDRQIRLFHKIVGFKRLGLIYTDTEIGRSYAALVTVQKAAQELGFEIVSFTDVMEDPPDQNDIPKAEAKYVEAVQSIGPKVDALYLAIQAGLTDASLPQVLAASRRFRLPTFVMEGANFVWKGALLGESNNIVTIEGLYSARKLSRILAGEKPRAQPQSNPHLSHIAVNLASAKKLGFDVPVDILLSADDVYTDILTENTEAQK